MSETPRSPTSGHTSMRPRARLISLIGDELISDEPVAVVELVKNAYDADATCVHVRFKCDGSATPNELVIVDDGVGMSLDTVLHSWFEPGTIKKKRVERSDQGRLLQGAKGVGRFAAARLARSLYLETKNDSDPDGVTVLLDWGRFDDDSYLDEVTIDYEVNAVPELAHGTRLTLLDLQTRKQWKEHDFRQLHLRLSRLISPFSADTNVSDHAEFSIHLEIPGFSDLTGRVEPHDLTRSPRYLLRGTCALDGTFTGTLSINDDVVRDYLRHPLGKRGETVGCGEFEVEIRVWDRDRDGLAGFMLKYDQTLTGVRQILDEYCGVSIYRDGFRVHPYGELGNDWLSLDQRSRQSPTKRIANKQIIAAIRISRLSNPELRDRTNREGLVHSSEYFSLVDWFHRVLSLLEEERYKRRPREDDKPETVSTIYEVFDMSEVVREANEQLGVTHPVAKLVKKKDTDIREGVVRLQEHYSRILLAAGLGHLVDVVVHEIGSPLGRITREIAYLKKSILDKIGPTAFDKLAGDGRHEELAIAFSKIDTWLEQLASLRQRLIPRAAGKRGKATVFNVVDEITDNIALFESLIARQKITVNMVTQGALIVKMARANLGQVLANLLDNAIYWLNFHHGDGNGGRIQIELSPLETGFSIVICDDGPGIAIEDQEMVFEQEFSRKANGMGLGLFIARQVIAPYGRIIYRDDCTLHGACFEALFETKVGL